MNTPPILFADVAKLEALAKTLDEGIANLTAQRDWVNSILVGFGRSAVKITKLAKKQTRAPKATGRRERISPEGLEALKLEIVKAVEAAGPEGIAISELLSKVAPTWPKTRLAQHVLSLRAAGAIGTNGKEKAALRYVRSNGNQKSRNGQKRRVKKAK